MTNQRKRIYQLILVVLVGVVPLASAILISIKTGYFAPLQSSLVVDVGICTQNITFEPVENVQADTETVWICGILDGDTRRYVGFTVFYHDQAVFQRELNLRPGYFYIPLQADGLYFIQASSFPEGKYKLSFAYSRDPVETVEFYVAK